MLFCLSRASASFIDDWIQSFADSEIVFQRSTTNVPFFPLVYADYSHYRDTEIERGDAESQSYDLDSVSQAALFPFLIGKRDIVFVGEWVGYTRFDARESGTNSFDTLSIGIPFGWFGQLDDVNQSGAFAMPLFHRADLDDSNWSQEVIGGFFGRYLQSDDVSWLYGFYFDIGDDGDDVYLPYLGASWELDEEVTLSAVLPWPAVLYAPDRDTLYRFGARPSGASWSLNSSEDQIYYNLGTWKLGASAEYRVHGNIWAGVEAGVAGLRSLRLSGGDWEGAEFDVNESGYLSLTVNFRPEVP